MRYLGKKNTLNDKCHKHRLELCEQYRTSIYKKCKYGFYMTVFLAFLVGFFVCFFIYYWVYQYVKTSAFSVDRLKLVLLKLWIMWPHSFQKTGNSFLSYFLLGGMLHHDTTQNDNYLSALGGAQCCTLKKVDTSKSVSVARMTNLIYFFFPIRIINQLFSFSLCMYRN